MLLFVLCDPSSHGDNTTDLEFLADQWDVTLCLATCFRKSDEKGIAAIQMAKL